jgi:hypothetical protein
MKTPIAEVLYFPHNKDVQDALIWSAYSVVIVQGNQAIQSFTTNRRGDTAGIVIPYLGD